MPELPEVETVARGLAKHLPGRRIAGVLLSRAEIVHGEPAPLCAVLRGRRIRGVHRRGKHLLLRTDGPMHLAIHLGMTGQCRVTHPDVPLEPHCHLRLLLAGKPCEMRFIDPRRFGGVWLVRDTLLSSPDAKPAKIGWTGRRLPPAGVDPLSVGRDEFAALLRVRRQLKALLLDQSVLGGVGNIYADESLHRAGLHPLRSANSLPIGQVHALWRALRRVLRSAIRAGGSSVSDYRDADGQAGWFQFAHRVYQRAGQPCRSCGSTIRHIQAAGRSTFFCPRCQPAPRNAK